MSYDLYGMEDGDLLKTHGPDQCQGNHCALHNPSDHPLSHAVMKWDRSRNLMVRFCQHGIWHPDPDDLAFKHRATSAYWASQCEQHQCDGCCGGIHETMIEAQIQPTLWNKTKWACIAFWAWIKSFLPKRNNGQA